MNRVRGNITNALGIAKESIKDVVLDNNDEGVGYFYFWGRAVRSALGGVIK